jgi:Na+:H+ antiporter, NhaA family
MFARLARFVVRHPWWTILAWAAVAIVVIAFAYTTSLSLTALVIAAGMLMSVLGAQRLGIQSPIIYLGLGVVLWAAFLTSGIHATIAGVLLAFLTPASSRFSPQTFIDAIDHFMMKLKNALRDDDEEQLEATLGAIEEATLATESALERAERIMHPWVAYLVLPSFALVNAGVTISAASVMEAYETPLTVGIIVGLLVGKVGGVVGGTWVAAKIGLAALSEGLRWVHLVGAGVLGGIGFTVSLFITDLAFDDPALIEQAKIGILTASVVASVLGYALLRRSSANSSSISRQSAGS